MNPRVDINSEHVCESNLEEVLWKVTKFKSTNNKLHKDTRRKLISLYAKIYETPIVTNNKFMSWVVKGYITKAKGWPINWAKVVAYITREKARKESTKKMQCAFNKFEFSKLSAGSKLSGGEASTNKSQGHVLKGVKYLKQRRPSNV